MISHSKIRANAYPVDYGHMDPRPHKKSDSLQGHESNALLCARYVTPSLLKAVTATKFPRHALADYALMPTKIKPSACRPYAT
ncbi:hypothetical protein K443DRAFT_510180 [Laccaria amethystina LaAM-08-1]|uniref:Unplaced genomic scaffold K443scaffold_53, whole genome shotgun sequence n=1 Tax=Laccaria amethystina LaAM-08-1 TaxID=1095629 RepID=A0A0C9WUB2_9AGAR|nr:hypothetical protein K443DRAFT_510180 [Laccaria amethystina LaAM-08-1]